MQTPGATLLVVILHNANLLPDLLKAWRKINVPGSTILLSAGSYMAEHLVKRSGLSSLLSVFDQNILQQRLLLSIIDDSEILELAIAEADRVVKGFDSPNSGILFTMPVGQTLGLQKWISTPKEERKEIKEEPQDQRSSRLMAWFEEDVKARYGEDALIDWSKPRLTPVADIIHLLGIQPTTVRVDTSLFEVVNQLQSNPGMPAACVVNNEDRLVGVIPLKNLAEVMMAPVMPEAYIHDPEGYDKALKYADVQHLPIAATIMIDPIFVMDSDTLEETYQRMKENNLSGLPVVDKLYRVQGFITMIGLMAVCFPRKN